MDSLLRVGFWRRGPKLAETLGISLLGLCSLLIEMRLLLVNDLKQIHLSLICGRRRLEYSLEQGRGYCCRHICFVRDLPES